MAAATDHSQTSLIQYVEGDATAPVGDGLKIIAHCCNDIGAWGAGFVMALSKRWERPEREYREWYRLRKKKGEDLRLGSVQIVPVEDDITIANIIGQHGIRRARDGTPPIRYEALSRGFELLAKHILNHPELNASVHAPRIGCGLAGASWSQVEPLLDRHFVTKNIPVTVYDWPGSRYNP